MLAFASMEISYLAQVNRLRKLARQALPLFPLRAPTLHFINHGENTTFRVEAGGKRYLLRIHRAGYHSEPALLEEISWLRRLARNEEVITPVPVQAKSGRWLELVKTPHYPAGRHCDLLEWVHGTFLRKNMPERRIHQLGSLIARLQKNSGGQSHRHRRYWTAEGLVGRDAKFGAIDSIKGISRRQQEIVSEGRKVVFAKLRAFERRFPERQGLIHADLHFGNFVVQGDCLGAIDFDDCGLGFHAYDLAVPLTHLENMCAKEEPAKYERLFEVIQEGYAAEAAWDAHDRAILPYFVTARRLLMLGWLNSRAENSKFRDVLPGAVRRALNHMRKNRTLE
ncbi:MAG: phosphotransferase enzyme family protein [Bdellovibrionota bacterium]